MLTKPLFHFFIADEIVSLFYFHLCYFRPFHARRTARRTRARCAGYSRHGAASPRKTDRQTRGSGDLFRFFHFPSSFLSPDWKNGGGTPHRRRHDFSLRRFRRRARSFSPHEADLSRTFCADHPARARHSRCIFLPFHHHPSPRPTRLCLRRIPFPSLYERREFHGWDRWALRLQLARCALCLRHHLLLSWRAGGGASCASSLFRSARLSSLQSLPRLAFHGRLGRTATRACARRFRDDADPRAALHRIFFFSCTPRAGYLRFGGATDFKRKKPLSGRPRASASLTAADRSYTKRGSKNSRIFFHGRIRPGAFVTFTARIMRCFIPRHRGIWA